MREIGLNSYTFSNILKQLNDIKVMVSVSKSALITETELIMDGDPVSFINGEPVKNSINNRETVRLALPVILDLFHNGASIYVISSESVKYIAKRLSTILDTLEGNIINNEQKEVFDYINKFYDYLVVNKRETLLHVKEDKMQVLGFNDDMSSTYTDKAYKIDLSDVIVK